MLIPRACPASAGSAASSQRPCRSRPARSFRADGAFRAEAWDAAEDGQTAVALAEIELCAELIIAASACDGPMEMARVDEVLRVARGGRKESVGSAPRLLPLPRGG
ncbi:hypothetical protein [Allostreptomyces psammosilenae]|uniref:Uncharacterized protein n=1 Tax=Allostreptomyces psammosilenae TaxID=1892865 RepID=A0A852ZYP2_9ACTN|nr:hypothetical protein [Allostreptomyces psammosilenae]NYI07503.1 hypothetical protein [Allostreptomyces psammosilenae]